VPADRDPPRDPRSILRERRRAQPSPEAADHVEELLELQGAWLLRRVRAVANDYRLVTEDLYQEVVLRILRCSTAVDAQNRGVRTWLAKRVEFTALDMSRQKQRAAPVAPFEVDAADQSDADGDCSGRQQNFDFVLDVYHLVERCHLTLNEARTVALRCSGVDMTFKEYATLVGRSHASIRKEYERGMRKVEASLGLNVDEHEIMRAMFRHGSPSAVAVVMGYSEEYVQYVASRAAKKINQFFEGQEGCL
jgi:RNA polymerase sigma factor (sigma-70 family)